MAYKELIKNFEKIRSYMRDFYVYGFKSRDDFKSKSSRSYDNEKRRIESWLGDYMKFSRNETGKNVFISIDSRSVSHNPLYSAWKSKSFTDGDITLHFIIFDILHSPEISLTLSEISDKIHNEYLSCFENYKSFDDSTIRKKLKEYIKQGLIVTNKQGKSLLYSRSEAINISDVNDILNFCSETIPCGEVGSFLLDKYENQKDIFTFKHHYITGTMDSEIMMKIFKAINQKSVITVTNFSKKGNSPTVFDAVPLKIFISSQNGRQYLMCYHLGFKSIHSYRLDYLTDIKIKEVCPEFDSYICKLKRQQRYMWGVSCKRKELQTEHIEFTIHFEDNEEYILKRLKRECRCGKVQLIDKNNAKFTADIYDTSEIIPWIRTFICRITSINFSNKETQKQFKDDLMEMYSLYGGECNV